MENSRVFSISFQYRVLVAAVGSKFGQQIATYDERVDQ